MIAGTQRSPNHLHPHHAGDTAVGAAPALPPTWYAPVKVLLDFVLALGILIVASPLILLAAVLVKLTSRGPVIYSQVRVGRHGRLFSIYKLRTMVVDAERHTGPRWSSPCDPRVTPLGRILRSTHIDELPQLWNVLRGDMSLVGPRPERPEFVPQLQRAIPHYPERLWVRPGITGLAQVQLPADTDISSVCRKLAYDRYYVHRMSFWLDARLIFSTALHVLRVPFRVSRRLLRLPCGAGLELAYASYVKGRPLLQPQAV
jgi:lipopolysaccharide/colanic/teichoic acid biosynthesis glycosyltransferase